MTIIHKVNDFLYSLFPEAEKRHDPVEIRQVHGERAGETLRGQTTQNPGDTRSLVAMALTSSERLFRTFP